MPANLVSQVYLFLPYTKIYTDTDKVQQHALSENLPKANLPCISYQKQKKKKFMCSYFLCLTFSSLGPH